MCVVLGLNEKYAYFSQSTQRTAEISSIRVEEQFHAFIWASDNLYGIAFSFFRALLLYTYITRLYFLSTIQQLLGFCFAHVAIVAMAPFSVERIRDDCK